MKRKKEIRVQTRVSLMAMNHVVSFLALKSRQNLHSQSRLSPSRLAYWRSFRNKDQTDVNTEVLRQIPITSHLTLQ